MLDHPLERLGWRPEFQTSLDALGEPELVPARVMAIDLGRAVVDAGQGTWSAPLAGRLRARGAPATGDFVAVIDGGPVRAVLPRQGVIARRGDRGRPEVLAANVQLALVATSANRDLNPRRLARFMAMTTRGDVETLVLLTKADLVGDASAVAAALAECLDGTPVLPVSVVDGTGLAALREHLTRGRTAVLLGSSGVGKSALVNALLGSDRQATGPIRARDDRGRHTTVRRELVPLAGGSLLIDTPGLRLVSPVEDGDPDVPVVVTKEQLRRQRRERERAFHREIYRDMRERRRGREARDDRRRD